MYDSQPPLTPSFRITGSSVPPLLVGPSSCAACQSHHNDTSSLQCGNLSLAETSRPQKCLFSSELPHSDSKLQVCGCLSRRYDL